MCFTSRNQLVEGYFKDGVLQKGNAQILYPNGEFYR